MAPDVMTFLVREQEFPYLFTRLHFFLGLELLLASVATRAYMLLTPPALGKAFALFLLTLMVTMLAYFQTTTAPFYKGIVHMMRRFVVLAINELGCQQPSLGIIGAASLTGGIFFLVKVFVDLSHGHDQ